MQLTIEIITSTTLPKLIASVAPYGKRIVSPSHPFLLGSRLGQGVSKQYDIVQHVPQRAQVGQFATLTRSRHALSLCRVHLQEEPVD